MKTQDECNVEDCKIQVKPRGSRGLCNGHYKKWLRGQKDLPANKTKAESRIIYCSYKNCKEPYYSMDFCFIHYGRNLNGTNMDKPFITHNKGLVCKNPDCTKPAHAKGFCKNCHKKFIKYGDAQYKKPIQKRLTSNGYVAWHEPENIHSMSDGNVLEHRYIIGEEIGRRLTREENVHHKDGNRANNKRENLELWNTSQPPGQRVEDKIKWAKEIIKMYENIELINQ